MHPSGQEASRTSARRRACGVRWRPDRFIPCASSLRTPQRASRCGQKAGGDDRGECHGDRPNHVTPHIAGEVAERPSATCPCTWASQRPRGVDYAKQGRTRLIGSGPDSSEPANFPPPSYVRLSVGERYGAGDRGSAARLPGPLIFWVSGPAGVGAPLPSTPAPIPYEPRIVAAR